MNTTTIYWYTVLRGRKPERRRFSVNAHGDDYSDLYFTSEWSELVEFVAARQADADRMRARLGTEAVWQGTVAHPSPYEPGSTCEITVKVADVGTCAVATLMPATASGATPDPLLVIPHWRRAAFKPEHIKECLKFLPSSERTKITVAVATALPESQPDHVVVTFSGQTYDMAYEDFRLVLARAVLGWLSDRDCPKAANS